jgi:prepilin-type processing-associated H-X9-DG protein
VELLVVIGIIAILIAILMPALSRARNQALSVQCMSNMRQLYQVALMFSTDNKQHLPRPSIPNGSPNEDASNPDAGKVCIWLVPPGSVWGRADLTGGVLAQYVPGEQARRQLVWCPADNGESTLGGGNANSGGPDDGDTGRNHSYSFNAQTMDTSDVRRGGTIYMPKGIRISTVSRGAERIYIYEEIAPNDSWCLMFDNLGSPQANMEIGQFWRRDDVPSGRHAGQKYLNAIRDLTVGSPDWFRWAKVGKGNFVFFDGHVETLSPADLYKRPDYYGPLRNPAPPPENPFF